MSEMELFSNTSVWVYIFGLVGAKLAVLIGIKIYAVVTRGVCKSEKRLDGKTVIVTGANKGIGKEIALDLAARGARVILGCRNLELANAARDEIITKTSNENVIVHQLDLSSLSSVWSFAKTILSTEDRLDVLINNAGAAFLENTLTKDHLQVEIQTNYIGPFLLSNSLTDILKASAPSRIVFTSSLFHRFARKNLDQLEFKPATSEFSILKAFRYSFTKLATVANAVELAERLEGTGVTVNSLHPGVVSTDIFDNTPFWSIYFFKIFSYYWKTPAEGAQTAIYLAVAEEVEGVTGKYFSDCKESTMARTAQDKEYRKRLWEKTEEMIHKAME